jgi:predicted nuclease with RNAse H fold
VIVTLSFGIDLTSGEAKSSACVVLDTGCKIVFHDFLDSNDRIIKTVNEFSPFVVAIDAPLSLPEGLCSLEEECPSTPLSPFKGRECERLLAKERIPCYFTTKRSIIKEMVYRGMKLADDLRQNGFKVIEVYPYASKRRLFGSPIPKKTSAARIAWLREKVDGITLDDRACTGRWNHDLCDALIAAYTGLLFLKGNTQALGNTREGYIYIPRSGSLQPVSPN